MENKQGGFSLVEPGGPIDFVAQIYSLPFQVLRNIQAYNDPDEYGVGTAIGHLMNKEGGLMSIFGNNQPQGDGLIGNGFVSTTDVGDYGYNTYNYGNEDIGVEHTGGGWSSNPSADDMAHSEVGSYASYDDPDEF